MPQNSVLNSSSTKSSTTTNGTTTTKVATNVFINETNAKNSSIKYREREQWGNKFEFILACMAYAIGLGNVWRFPYLCYKNGGGAFLIPYVIFLVFGGVPVLFLEVAIGQYFRNGGITVWQLICPFFKGIGYGTIAVAFILNIYYIIIISWALLYLYYSFSWVLPWSTCDNEWNTERCWSPDKNTTVQNDSVNSVIEFWERKIIQISDGIEQPNGLQPELTLTLLLAWVICFFCIWRGIKSTGKAVYVTAIFPYFVMTALFIRGITLPGAGEGIKFYLTPDFNRLSEPQVWIDAGTQIFFSYAIALGCMTALGSYNQFNNDFYHQLLFLTAMNSGTSLYAGFAIFSVLGFMAHEQGLSVSQVADGGPGLAFIAYPRAVAQMPGAQIWAILFFVMILLLGLGSQFVGVEGLITAVVDVFPQYLRYGNRREWFIFGICLISYLIGLSMVTRGGIYVFQLFDSYGASGMCLLWFCFFETIVIGWIYSADKLYKNIEDMIGFRMFIWFKLCWKYFTPLLTTATFVFYAVHYQPVKYNNVYEYPVWATMFGWSLALCSMVIVPIYCIYIWIITPQNKRSQLFCSQVSPYFEKESIEAQKLRSIPENSL